MYCIEIFCMKSLSRCRRTRKDPLLLRRGFGCHRQCHCGHLITATSTQLHALRRGTWGDWKGRQQRWHWPWAQNVDAKMANSLSAHRIWLYHIIIIIRRYVRICLLWFIMWLLHLASILFFTSWSQCPCYFHSIESFLDLTLVFLTHHHLWLLRWITVLVQETQACRSMWLVLLMYDHGRFRLQQHLGERWLAIYLWNSETTVQLSE